MFVWLLSTAASCLLIPLLHPIHFSSIYFVLVAVTLLFLWKALVLLRSSLTISFAGLNLYAFCVLTLVSVDRLLDVNSLAVNRMIAMVWSGIVYDLRIFKGMKKKLIIAAHHRCCSCLLATVAWHRFRVQTKGLLFAVFPIFSWVSVDQPIVFNHIHHREVAKLNCTFCHRYVEKYRAATIPNIEICQACHSTDAISKRPQALKVVEYVKAGQQIPWKRMYELPAFVVFPHWLHIQKRSTALSAMVSRGLTERPVKMVDRNYMEWCIHCHKKRGASDDCYTCHSS